MAIKKQVLTYSADIFMNQTLLILLDLILMPKVWLALFFGYNGQNFCGMQHQREEAVQSIEKLIVTTLHKEGFLATKNFGELVKNYRFGRAARTDKGVHAVVNGISCLFTISEQFYDESKTLKRNELFVKIKMAFENTDIIVHGLRRVTCRFDMRQMVKSRTYCYICPFNYFSREQMTSEEQQRVLKKIDECCQKFVGTHNFHNYSKDLKAKDPKAKRYIMEFKCEKLDKKWLKFVIKGQSFVYHQIRKIIGSIIQVFLSQYDPSFINNTFFNNQFYVPLAPPFGLYLRFLTFDSYNRKTEIPEKIDLSQQNESLEKVQKGIKDHILQISEENWQKWFEQVKEGIVPKFSDDQQQLVDDD